MKMKFEKMVRFLSLCLILAMMLVSAGCEAKVDNDRAPVSTPETSVSAENVAADATDPAEEVGKPTDVVQSTDPVDAETTPVPGTGAEPTEKPATEQKPAQEQTPVEIKPTEHTRPADTPTVEPPTPTTPPKEEPSVEPTEEPTAPPETTPQINPTEPPATEPVPEETEPIGCQHSWQMFWHPEEGHYSDPYVLCTCGARFQTQAAWLSHVKQNAAEAVDFHTSWCMNEDWIVDSPEYTEWVCSKCGEATTAQP